MTEQQIHENKEKFISLLKSINRQNADIDRLVMKLESSDFFEAPASTKYHGSFKGGLCQHCLSVYNNLLQLVNMKNLSNDISSDSIIIVALLHDFSKMNFYKKDYRNKKVYSSTGSKKDEGGNFDWVVEQSYTIIPEEERFLYGNHEETSEFMVRNFIPLSCDESCAILYHHAGMSFDSTQNISGKILERYPLATLLHIADMMSAYIDKV